MAKQSIIRDPNRIRSTRIPPGAVVRMFILGAVAVIGSGYAIIRYYQHQHARRAQMVAPAPAKSADAGAAEDEIPIEMGEGD